MNNLTIFNNNLFGQVRGLLIDEQPYFVGKDVAEALGYKKPSNAINQHCKHALKQGIVDNTGFEQSMNIIPMGDVIRLAVKSNLPGAEEFEEWIMDEVIPQLLTKGVYITESATQEAITYESLFGRRRIRKTIRDCHNYRALFESFMELSKVERDAHRIDNDDRIRVCEVFMDELENNLANEAVNMRGSELLAIQELLTDLAKEKNRLSNKKNGGIKSNMTVKINDLEQENQALKQQIEELTPPEHEWITCDIHGFSENYMYSWSDKGQVTRSKAYNRWINVFPADSVPDREYFEQYHNIDFNKDVAIEICYICKKEFDPKNFDKATLDMIFNRILGVDDNIVTRVLTYKVGTCDSYNDGKIIFTIYNI